MRQQSIESRYRVAAWISAMVLCLAPVIVQAQSVARFSTQGDFDSMKDEVLLAIQSRGLVVDHTSYIGNMLDRTAKDVGASKRVYIKAEAIQFCSAVVSRRTMEADPANIAFCPYVIALYVRPDEPGTVHAVFRRISGAGSDASRVSLREVDALLEAIVKEALGLK